MLFAILCMIPTVQSQKFIERNGGHCYTMKVADYLVRTYELNDVASLQYQNTMKEVYMIVIHDTKDELEKAGIVFTGASDFLGGFVGNYKTEAADRRLSEEKAFKENGASFAQVELNWTEDENAFYMLITAIETDKAYYKILMWTLGQHETIYKSDFAEMARSLKD